MGVVLMISGGSILSRVSLSNKSVSERPVTYRGEEVSSSAKL